MAQSWGYAYVQAGGDTGRCGSGAQRAPSVSLELWFRLQNRWLCPAIALGRLGVSRGLRPCQPVRIAEFTVRTEAHARDVSGRPRRAVTPDGSREQPNASVRSRDSGDGLFHIPVLLLQDL